MILDWIFFYEKKFTLLDICLFFNMIPDVIFFYEKKFTLLDICLFFNMILDVIFFHGMIEGKERKPLLTSDNNLLLNQ